MTKDEIKAYITEYGDRDEVLRAIKMLKEENREISEEALNEILYKEPLTEEEPPSEIQEAVPEEIDDGNIENQETPKTTSTLLLIVSCIAIFVGLLFSDLKSRLINPVLYLGIALMVSNVAIREILKRKERK